MSAEDFECQENGALGGISAGKLKRTGSAGSRRGNDKLKEWDYEMPVIKNGERNSGGQEGYKKARR
jgi:hypothetical protein